MRTIFLLSFLFITLLSCQKDDEQPIGYVPPVLEDLHLVRAKEIIPIDLLSQYKQAVYINEKGEEKTIGISYSLETLERLRGSFPYRTELLRINYSDQTVKTFWMSIYATAEYSSIDEHHEFTSVSRSAFEENEVLTDLIFDQSLFESIIPQYADITVAGLTFHDVFSEPIGPSHNSQFKEIYYSTSQGIVAFKGENGKMWGLKRYE